MSGSSENGDLKQRVARVVAEEVAPLLQMDGNEIEVVAVEDGSVQAVILGIEDELRRRVAEVEYLDAVP